MKTISARLNINHHGFNESITAKKSYRNRKYYQHYDRAAGDINRNATVAQVECQRDACEEELYRLRYGIENLLANMEQGDFKARQRQRFGDVQTPFRTMPNRIPNFNNRKNQSWLDRCSPCCRRWTRNRSDDNFNIPNEYNYDRGYNDRNYDLPLRRTQESPVQSQLYSDSFVSNPPSPSISPRYIDPNRNHRKNDLRRSIDTLIDQNTPNKTNRSDLLTSKDINDPVYNSLILKILEAKALDCLCTGYSKQNTREQISHALAQINQRVDEHQWDSESATSSRSLPASYESPSPVSSILTDDDDKSTSSRSITPQLYSPLSSVKTPNPDQTKSTFDSPDKIKDSLKVNEDVKSAKKKSKVTNRANKTSRSSKSKKKKKPSSNRLKKPSSKHRRKPSSNHLKKPSSKRRKKPSSKSRKKPTTKKQSKSKKSNRKPRSSKSRTKRSSSKPRSRSKHRKKPKSKRKKSTRKKTTKPRSNNQVNDNHETDIVPTFIYPQSYQEVYRNRQRLLKLLLFDNI